MGKIWSYLSKNVPMKEPWRYDDENVFTEEKKNQLLDGIVEIDIPEQSQALNLLVIGYKGSGKSALINTFKTVVRNTNQVCTVVPAYGPNHGCTSKKLNGVTLKTLSSGQKICAYDTCGIQREPLRNDNDISAAIMDDLKKTIAGHVKHEYEFQEISIHEESEFYRRRPTLSDRMHCVLFVINAEQVQERPDYNTLLRVQRHLADENVPLRLVLTQVDKLHPGKPEQLSGIFHDRLVDDKVRKVKEIFSLQDCHILPIANYVNSKQNLNQDVLALLALDNILQESLAAFQ